MFINLFIHTILSTFFGFLIGGFITSKFIQRKIENISSTKRLKGEYLLDYLYRIL